METKSLFTSSVLATLLSHIYTVIPIFHTMLTRYYVFDCQTFNIYSRKIWKSFLINFGPF
jgi:hypothetical protein